MSHAAARFCAPVLRRVRREESSAGIAHYLRTRTRLFKRVSDQALRLIAQASRLRRYAPGEFVCRTGDPAREMWVVQKGRLCVRQQGWTGRVLSLEFMLPGDVSGLAALGCSTYPGEVAAMRDSRIIVIPIETVRTAVELHPELAREILYSYCSRIHYVETRLSLSREPAEKRLIAALLFLYGKFGFELPLTSAEIGATAGTTPETAMRALKSLERRGWLRRSRGRVEIADLAALKARLGAEFGRL